MAMRNAYYSAAGNGPGISRPAPGDLGPSFGQTFAPPGRLMLPFVLLDWDFKSGAIGHHPPRLSPTFRGPFPEKQAAGPGNPPDFLFIIVGVYGGSSWRPRHPYTIPPHSRD